GATESSPVVQAIAGKPMRIVAETDPLTFRFNVSNGRDWTGDHAQTSCGRLSGEETGATREVGGLSGSCSLAPGWWHCIPMSGSGLDRAAGAQDAKRTAVERNPHRVLK